METKFSIIKILLDTTANRVRYILRKSTFLIYDDSISTGVVKLSPNFERLMKLTIRLCCTIFRNINASRLMKKQSLTESVVYGYG